MRKTIMMILLMCSMSLLAFSQSKPTYQVGTILAVVPVQSGNDSSAPPKVYHVSVKVNDSVYVVRYFTEQGFSVKYLAGMQLPVLVGEDTIKFNDLLGRSYEVPIVKRQLAANKKAN